MHSLHHQPSWSSVVLKGKIIHIVVVVLALALRLKSFSSVQSLQQCSQRKRSVKGQPEKMSLEPY